MEPMKRHFTDDAANEERSRPEAPASRGGSAAPDYRQARFLTSVASIRSLPADTGREVAFAGRSNAGKSSAINTLTGRRHLARTSRTPGRTRLINYFELDERRRLVDLPGYGYAKAPRSMTREWGKLVGKYLEARESLAGVVMLMDIRHPFTELDMTLFEWCRAAALPVLAVLTRPTSSPADAAPPPSPRCAEISSSMAMRRG